MAQAIETVVPSESTHERGATGETFLSIKIPPIGIQPTDIKRATTDPRCRTCCVYLRNPAKTRDEGKIRKLAARESIENWEYLVTGAAARKTHGQEPARVTPIEPCARLRRFGSGHH